MKKYCCIPILLLTALTVSAQGEAEETIASREAAEHQRIRTSRVDALAQFAARDAQCYQRFAVNDCLAEVRVQRRDLLSDLRRQEISLNEAQRKRRAAAQLLRSDDRASGRP